MSEEPESWEEKLLVDIENARARKLWRAGFWGRVLGIHSPLAHMYEQCWCQRSKK